MEILEEPVMKEEVEDTPKEDPIKPCTNSCYSSGEEGHISQNQSEWGSSRIPDRGSRV